MTANEPVALIVDDEPAVRQLLQRLLERQGFRVRAASNDEEALDAANRTRHLRLAVLDMNLQGQSGVEVLGAIRTAHPGVRVLFISGDPAALGLVENKTARTTAVLAKPFTAEELTGAVNALLAGAGPPGARRS